MEDHTSHLVAIFLLEKTLRVNKELKSALQESEDRHREKDMTIAWMGGGYSMDRIIEPKNS